VVWSGEAHLSCQHRVGVRSIVLELSQDRVEHVRRLVLAHLLLSTDASRRETESDGALTDLAFGLFVGSGAAYRPRVGDVTLEGVDESSKYVQIRFAVEQLGGSVQVRDDEVPGRDRRPGRIPAGGVIP
jgi:hypothetical protein